MSDMEQDDELNTMLARNFGPPHARAAHAETIEPSSGFAASVMERVREEAAATAALSPIQFPWRRALPGICMAVLAIAVCATLLVLASAGAVQLASHAFASAAAQGPQTGPHGTIVEWIEIAMRLHVGWLLAGFLIAFVPLTLSRGLMGDRQRG
jgi:hypothetical protein